MDLSKLKPLIENGLKVNKSRLARELDVDRRTVSKYIDGYSKPSTRNKSSLIDEYYDIIEELLNNEVKVFEYKKVLWIYLKENYGLDCAESSFRYYIQHHPEFQSYFDGHKADKIKATSIMRFETNPGEQAQLDWL